MDAPLFMVLEWDLEYHVHINAINLVVGAMLIQNLTKKCDQPIACASHLFNNIIEKNCIVAKKEALTMVYALHKFHHYLSGDKFVFYVNHMTFLHLIKKP
jgi:hypothetical protein